MAAPFVYFDIRTKDLAKSKAFYTGLFDWKVQEVPVGNATISFLVDERGPWGGFTELAADDTRRPQWIPYAPVDDVDKAAEKAVSLGATIIRERTEIPQGSLVVIDDPSGATLILWQERAG